MGIVYGLGWVALYVVMRYVIGAWWQKHLADQGARRRALILQYFACFCLAVVGVTFFGGVKFDASFAVILVIGFANGFACYCQWQANAVSMSKNSLFTFLDDCIALLLAYIILHETKFLNPMLIAGTLLSVGVAVCYGFHDYPKRVKEERNALGKSQSAGVPSKLPPHSLIYYVAWYSVIWGVANFSCRYFAVQEIGAFQFLVPWYTGALIAAAYVYCTRDRSETMPDGSPIVPLDLKGLAMRFGFGVLIALCLAVEYKALERTPQAVVQPILLVAELLVATAIGLYWFHEREKLDPGEGKYFAFGILGGLLAAAGFIVG